MDSKQLIEDIRSFCIKNGSPETLMKYQRYFKGGFDGYGLTNAQISSFVKDYLKSNKPAIDVVVEAMPELMESGLFEEASIGLLLLVGLKKQFSYQTFESIEEWFAIGIQNWAHADTLGMMILPLFFKNGIVGLSDFKPWIRSPYPFQRRCVPVTLIKSLKTTEDYTPFFKLISPLMDDKERVVHQGTGWFLREAWKRQNSFTEAFLFQYKNTSARLIFQYACEKMNKEDKLRFKKEK